MKPVERVAGAMAYFEACDDSVLLHQLIVEIAPRAKRMVASLMAKTPEDSLPGPAEVSPAGEPAGRDEALRTLRETKDFALFQALARSIGRRLEAVEIAASADFSPGARVLVPERPSFPPAGALRAGTVTETGTVLRVQLDDGEGWEGPPSLARLEGAR